MAPEQTLLEAETCEEIDKKLELAGWVMQDKKCINLYEATNHEIRFRDERDRLTKQKCLEVLDQEEEWHANNDENCNLSNRKSSFKFGGKQPDQQFNEGDNFVLTGLRNDAFSRHMRECL